MDYSKIQAKLDALKANTNKTTDNPLSKLIWKPTAGEHLIRILPNFHIGKDSKPFLPLMFYYDFGKTWLAPCQFDEPDAIADFYQICLDATRAEKDPVKNREKWDNAKVFAPQTRIYVPILVRGQESEGVKFWGFPKGVYLQLDSICDDPDYGNIFDLKTGRDLKINYNPGERDPKTKQWKTKPDTTILAKPNQTYASNDKDVLEAIKNMPNIIESFTKPTFAETQTALDKYLNGDKSPATEPVKPTTKSKVDDDFLAEMNAPVKTPVSADVDAKFDAYFDEE